MICSLGDIDCIKQGDLAILSCLIIVTFDQDEDL